MSNTNKIARWVKADQKPEYNRGVLVFIPEEDNHITSGMWDISNKWVLLDEYRVPECEVTHWTEMPDKPEGYEQEPLCPEMAQLLREKLKTASPTAQPNSLYQEVFMQREELKEQLEFERKSRQVAEDATLSLSLQLTQLREENERLNKQILKK